VEWVCFVLELLLQRVCHTIHMDHAIEYTRVASDMFRDVLFVYIWPHHNRRSWDAWAILLAHTQTLGLWCGGERKDRANIHQLLIA
jgi:hypothetical protein